MEECSKQMLKLSQNNQYNEIQNKAKIKQYNIMFKNLTA